MHAPSDNLHEVPLTTPVTNSLPTDTQLESQETAALLGSIDSGTYPRISKQFIGFSFTTRFPQKRKKVIRRKGENLKLGKNCLLVYSNKPLSDLCNFICS